jgi:uncharacterized RmlC-like cupin family protein
MSDVVLIKPHQRSANTAQTPGMVRQAGIAPELCGNGGLWMGFVSTPAATASGAHHHGDAESGIYIVRGSIRFFYGSKLERLLVAEEGDFIYVPPMAVHVEENLSPDEPVEFIVSRNSTTMLVVNVPDPREGTR